MARRDDASSASLDAFTFPWTESESESWATDSPADHIFFNGKLLPHAFPVPCRSSSTRSSLSSSARTSSSDISDRRPLQRSGSVSRVQNNSREGNRIGLVSHHSLYRSSSQGLRFIMAPVPSTMSHRRRRSEDGAVKASSPRDGSSSKCKQGFCRGLLRSFSSTCKQCHALEPPRKKEKDAMLFWIN